MSTLDPYARAVLDAMAAAGQPALEQLSPDEARAVFAQAFPAMQAPAVAVGEVRELAADGAGGNIPLRLYRPEGSEADALLPGMVYFHGGGFVIGGLDLYDGMCRRLCNATGCALVAVDYRLAPEHRFPAAAEDAITAVQWVADNVESLGIDGTRLAVGGDSAGANLAAVACLATRDASTPAIAHQLLIYPVTDLLEERDSYRRMGEGYFLTAGLMRHFIRCYLNGDGQRKDWRASPLRAASHAMLPPATVAVCGFDLLHDEGVAYAEALTAAGVPVTLLRYNEQIHGFLLMDGVIPAAAAAIEEIGRAVRTNIQRALHHE